jgi:hypothetical protein
MKPDSPRHTPTTRQDLAARRRPSILRLLGGIRMRQRRLSREMEKEKLRRAQSSRAADSRKEGDPCRTLSLMGFAADQPRQTSPRSPRQCVLLGFRVSGPLLAPPIAVRCVGVDAASGFASRAHSTSLGRFLLGSGLFSEEHVQAATGIPMLPVHGRLICRADLLQDPHP